MFARTFGHSSRCLANVTPDALVDRDDRQHGDDGSTFGGAAVTERPLDEFSRVGGLRGRPLPASPAGSSRRT